ncbi:MAG: translation initiation factor IF-2 [Bacteroidetes bacterium]|nr:translation initiation factor IF-2 [Bacteroidota bacterium]
MSEDSKAIRLGKAAKEFNIAVGTIVETLSKRGFKIETNANTKLTQEMYSILEKEFQKEKIVKEKASNVEIGGAKHTIVAEIEHPSVESDEYEEDREIEEIIIKKTTSDYPTKPQTVQPSPEKEHEPIDAKQVTAKKEEKVVEVEKEEKEEKEKKEDKKEEEKEKPEEALVEEAPEEESGNLKVLGKIDLDKLNQKTRPSRKSKQEKTEKKEKAPKEPEKAPLPESKTKETEEKPDKKPEITEVKEEQAQPIEAEIKAPVEGEKSEEKETVQEKKESNFIPTEVARLTGPKILDKIELPEVKKAVKKPVASSKDEKVAIKKKKRKRIPSGQQHVDHKTSEERDTSKGKKSKKQKKEIRKPELSEEEIQKQIRETLSRLSPTGKSKTSKHRRLKRAAISQNRIEEQKKLEEASSIIKVTEFVTVNELATMMNVSVTDVISACMSLGLFVSINQRLDAETLTVVAEEFGYKVEFVSFEVQEAISHVDEEEEHGDDFLERSPIVTVMGHVDHGKTKLLDYIRRTNVVAGEAGGITQHIGAYEVKLENRKSITFLDTPGHEAFTAMRARGAKLTDVAIIVVAADDSVMPQTKEAINHAQAAGVPIVFAINKIDKPNANVDRIKQQLADMNLLVEDWGGKYQSQEISAKEGINIDLLLDKVLLEAEMLELKGNPDRYAIGTVIESSLDKGRGYVAKILVQNGTLHIGDVVLAGAYSGKVKAMYNERNLSVKEAGPSSPILMLGLSGAPQAGDGFNVLKDEREARNIAAKRQQLQREQGYRTQKHITLDEIGRRIAIGDFKELNLIVKGDVDGSVEALSDSLLKLSTAEVQVNVLHRSVGAITESDVLLASASEAIIVGFQVRPTPSSRKLAEQEQIDIRLYSIIYQAIDEIKAAIEGMLSPEYEEKITCNIEVREVFKITKVGTVAGCYVLDGKVTRNTKVRIIRDGIVVYSGYLGSLKRFKDDVKEVNAGYECGLNIDNFNDIKVGDIVEGYEEVEIKRKL